jgi:hypothetical protein
MRWRPLLHSAYTNTRLEILGILQTFLKFFQTVLPLWVKKSEAHVRRDPTSTENIIQDMTNQIQHHTYSLYRYICTHPYSIYPGSTLTCHFCLIVGHCQPSYMYFVLHCTCIHLLYTCSHLTTHTLIGWKLCSLRTEHRWHHLHICMLWSEKFKLTIVVSSIFTNKTTWKNSRYCI